MWPMSATRNIGVFDSGVGGLSVLRRLQARMPGTGIHYLADQAFAPYGEKQLEEVEARAVSAASFLIDRGAAVVVVACNTASAAGLATLRSTFPSISFVGTEPAVKPAAATTTTGVIGVLATSVTFEGEMYANVVGTHASGITVVNRIGEGLAMAVERGALTEPETRRLLEPHVAALRAAGADTLVLGCTHYPFLADTIQSIAGPDVRIIDPSDAVARQADRVARHVSADLSGPVRFSTTAHGVAFADQVERLIGTRAAVREVSLSDLARPG